MYWSSLPDGYESAAGPWVTTSLLPDIRYLSWWNHSESKNPEHSGKYPLPDTSDINRLPDETVSTANHSILYDKRDW